MIPIVFIADENFIMQTHIAMKSLIMNKNADTEYDIFVVMAECPEEKKQELKVLESDQVKVNFIDASLDEFRDIKQLAHIPIACLLKFKVCDFVEKYDKLIYLDGDIIVRGDLSQLYQIDVENYYAGAVQSLENIHNGEKRYNAGVMLFNSKKMREDNISEQLIAVRKNLGDRGSMDQQTFNMLISDKMREIPCKYNCIPYKLVGNERKNYRIKDLNTLYATAYRNKRQIIDEAIIIHYATGGKPWRYTYIPCSEEWIYYYKLSIYGKHPLHRDTRMLAHITGLRHVIKKGGIKAVFHRIREYVTKDSNISKNWG